jgi:hypothetical protein
MALGNATDSTGVRPSGVLTRHPGDWFADNLFVGQYSFYNHNLPQPLFWLSVALYNFDPSGRVAKVYGISCVNDSGGGAGVFFQAGTIGAFQQHCTSIRPELGAPSCDIYQVRTNALANDQPPPYNWGTQYALIPSDGFDCGKIISPFPIFIVPVGWSLIIAPLFATGAFGPTFWFQLANH